MRRGSCMGEAVTKVEVLVEMCVSIKLSIRRWLGLFRM